MEWELEDHSYIEFADHNKRYVYRVCKLTGEVTKVKSTELLDLVSKETEFKSITTHYESLIPDGAFRSHTILAEDYKIWKDERHHEDGYREGYMDGKDGKPYRYRVPHKKERNKMNCLCCKKNINLERPRICPVCSHLFKGNGWDGIDAHWRSKHEDIMPYEDFWESLCDPHKK